MGTVPAGLAMTIGEIRAYWRTGLDLLLDGNETDAQMSWAMGWSLAEEQECSAAILEFITLLTEAAIGATHQKKYELAWALRQYIYEAAPQDIDNLVESWHLAHGLVMVEEQQQTFACLQELLTPENSEILILKLFKAFPDKPFSPIIMPLLRDTIDRQILKQSVVLDWILERRVFFANYLSPPDQLTVFQFCHQLDPDNPLFVLDIAIAYQEMHQTAESFTWIAKYLALDSSTLNQVTASFMKTRGLLQGAGNWYEAAANFEQYKAWIKQLITDGEKLDEMNAKGISSTGFTVFYFADNPQENLKFLKELNAYSCQQTQSHFLPLVAGLAKNYRSPDPDQKIRLGYISQCFYRHSIGWIARWLWQYHDRDRFEIYCYSLFKNSDDLQQYFIDRSDRFVTIHKPMPTDDAAVKIHSDGIDILIDLDVQTCNYTMGLLSLKPAPVIVSWLGSECSQHPLVDYYLADQDVIPADAQTYYVPQIYRLPNTYLAVNGFEIGISRFSRSDLNIPPNAIIYWSAQSNQKRHPEIIKLQMQILQAVPDSYFMIKGSQGNSIESLFIDVAQELGIAPDRLRFMTKAPTEEIHRAELQLADVVLDTYPYNGATTTLETLWLGIPLVTKVGQQFSARNSYMMLKNTGVTAGIAYSDQEYLDWGIRLGTDQNLRSQVHWQLIRSRQSSPLWNAKSFTKDLENAYQEMWNKYVNT